MEKRKRSHLHGAKLLKWKQNNAYLSVITGNGLFLSGSIRRIVNRSRRIRTARSRQFGCSCFLWCRTASLWCVRPVSEHSQKCRWVYDRLEVHSEGHRQCTLKDFIFYICLEICWWNLRIEPLMFLNRVIIYVSRLSENVHIITTIFMEKFLCVSNQMVTYARKQYHCLNCVI